MGVFVFILTTSYSICIIKNLVAIISVSDNVFDFMIWWARASWLSKIQTQSYEIFKLDKCRQNVENF